MEQRLLTIQDISCVGQCSLTVALPVISACGIETAILPSSVLSNHTMFSSWTFNDLTDDMEKILAEWKRQRIDFSAFYTGYVSAAQIPIIKKIIAETARSGALVIVDPVMADNGKMYPGFAADFPQKMAELCRGVDVILPNITEAAFLLGVEYPGAECGQARVEEMCAGLLRLGAKNIVLTGVSFESSKLGCCICDGKTCEYVFNDKIDASFHGTGDCFAASFAGSLCRGKSMKEAVQIACDFVCESIRRTLGDDEHLYGVKFEKALPMLVGAL